MNKTVITCLFFMAFAWTLAAQNPPPPPPPPAPPASVAASPSLTASISPSASVTPKSEDDTDTALDKKMRKHFHINVTDHNGKGIHKHDGEIPDMVVPIVAITMLTIFGAPVLIVGLIMYFGFSRNRMLHRTVRMMVEKGQPVPPELLQAPPPAVRQRSDMRRGIVLVMAGLGLMIFFGATSDWDGAAWSLGAIPFLIGAGFLLVWQLEKKKDNGTPTS